jgi:hypothetical protein
MRGSNDVAQKNELISSSEQAVFCAKRRLPLAASSDFSDFHGWSSSVTIPSMSARRFLCFGLLVGLYIASAGLAYSQLAPAAKDARTLLVPGRMVSGERATLAVLDANGRLTPGVTVNFSNGDTLKTDATGRALFVAPLNPGVMFASIEGRASRVPTAIVIPQEATSSSMEITAAPQMVMLTDRFEITGRGFCGEADSNQATVGGQAALVLASSPVSLVVLPPNELNPGTADVKVSCGKNVSPVFRTTFVELALEADTSPLKPGEHRTLTVHVRGTAAKVNVEARNLAPKTAELSGGTSVKQTSSGGANNAARFTVVGIQQGSFLVSIRLVPVVGQPLWKR